VEDEMNNLILVVVAGDSGVYAGWAAGGADALSDSGRVVLVGARHLRRYYVHGKVGDGSAGDLAAYGLDPGSASVSAPVLGDTALLGVRRLFVVSESVIDTFGCPRP
jgi:hypothetical protein